MSKNNLKFTDEEFKQALKNLEGAYFFKRDNQGKIIGITDTPTMEIILEEIKFIQYKRKQSNK